MARVLGPHGVHGELKCRLVTDFPERFQPGVRLLAGDPPAPATLLDASVAGDTAVLRLDTVADRDTAEAMRGQEILVAAEDAVALPEGEFFWRDILGLRVQDTTGTSLGTVIDILETGANDVYVVRGERGEILVPAIKDVVKSIEPAAGQMVIDPLPGMLPQPREQPARQKRSRRPHSR